MEQHGKLVERHGEGRIGKVIDRLQVEADTPEGIIIDTFRDDRSIGGKVTCEAGANKYSSRISNHMGSHFCFGPTCRRLEGLWVVLLVVIRADSIPGMDVSSDCPIPLEESFDFQTDPAMVRGALKRIEAAFEGIARELTNNGIMVFLNKVVKPKPRALLAETFRDMEYLISLEGDGNTYSHSSTNGENGQEGIGPESRGELVKLRFFDRYLSKYFCEADLGYAVRISELGVIRIESSFVGVVDVIIRGELYGVGDALAKCSQICLAVNLEEDKVEYLLTEAGGGGEDGGVIE
ncbi:hypothetical protein B9Z19DRAFT_1107177 [Tuber borchii]|uniref:Uncharacterized protein n=1 Tax=Tuber borchii TaxID=42251 RepID=A0A2T6ZXM4_TUBBO|nr:hypothetical protein B9Z19DRAFT_1107177 [Tuber borchii]